VSNLLSRASEKCLFVHYLSPLVLFQYWFRFAQFIRPRFHLDMQVAETAENLRVAPHAYFCVFNSRNKLWVEGPPSETGKRSPLSLAGDSKSTDVEQLIASNWPGVGTPKSVLGGSDTSPGTPLWLARWEHPLEEDPRPERAGDWFALRGLSSAIESQPEAWDPVWKSIIETLNLHAIEIPYLNFGRNEFIYRFRTDRQRNREIYQSDAVSKALYQSQLCAAVKAARRLRENTSGEPARLNFGRIEYLLPSHFGFCLGVQNAIERAYEVLAAHPDKRVFMLSELIHNPFVNKDLQRRGLHYLQTDKGVTLDDPETGKPYWETLSDKDIVIVPAFGATNEDKVRLVQRGLPFNEYDATCMLVEKVWKAGRRFADEGYTVVIHGKAEHEETKATFSNIARYGPALVVRDSAETKIVAQIIMEDDPKSGEALFEKHFKAKATTGFDPARDLKKIAVVNQTTLLRNETLSIIEVLEKALEERFPGTPNLHPKNRGDTLCYATQVNQDALQNALEEGIDLALVAGGKNSSNTFQLYRVCQASMGDRSAYIQSEENLLSKEHVLHYHFAQNSNDEKAGTFEKRAIDLSGENPIKVLITGGASCPDGIIQQIITRYNSYFDADKLRPIEAILEELE
jgi:4-hydroxy-3-methylbut-2-enyl diphosphate reductase